VKVHRPKLYVRAPPTVGRPRIDLGLTTG
jgi:hypothetical protein